MWEILTICNKTNSGSSEGGKEEFRTHFIVLGAAMIDFAYTYVLLLLIYRPDMPHGHPYEDNCQDFCGGGGVTGDSGYMGCLISMGCSISII